MRVEKKPPVLPFRELEDVKPKSEKDKKAENKEEKKKTKSKKPGVKVEAEDASSSHATAAATTREPRSSSRSSETSRATSNISRVSSNSSKAPSNASSCARSSVSNAPDKLMEVVVRLQQQQLEASLRQTAVSQLKEARPAKKFSGSAVKRMDFEKHMKLFNEMMEIPGATKKQILNEVQHWFEGSAFKLIEEMLRKSESAVDEAVEKLTKKFGMRQETALEMLDEVLQGKAIDEKDHNGMLDFYARLVSVHSFAVETKKADDFENKLVVKTCDKCNGFHHPLAHPEPNPAGKQTDDNKNAGEKGSETA